MEELFFFLSPASLTIEMGTSLTVRARGNEQQNCRFHSMSLPTEPDVCVRLMSSSTCWLNWICSLSLSNIYKLSASLPTLLPLPSHFCSINWCANAPVGDISGGKPVPNFYLYADLLSKPKVLSPSGKPLFSLWPENNLYKSCPRLSTLTC